MKKVLFLICSCFLLSSCMSIFSSSKQSITFTGEDGTKLYDGTNNVKLAEIKDEVLRPLRLKRNCQTRQ
jgi:hypothetical protein